MTILKWLTPALMALSSYAQPPYDSGFAAELKYGPSFPWPTVPKPTTPDVRNEEVLALVNEVFKDAGVGQTYQSVEGYRFIQLSKKKMYLVAAVTYSRFLDTVAITCTGNHCFADSVPEGDGIYRGRPDLDRDFVDVDRDVQWRS